MRDPRNELDDLDKRQLRRRLRTIEPAINEHEHSGVRIELDGRPLINFSSNDYLGLAQRNLQEEKLTDACGAGASRLVCGTHPSHVELEQALGAFKQTEAALTFSTGYACALGTLQALLQKNDIVILDKLCHASLIDGAKLSGATIRVFPHNDLAKLERHLIWAKTKTAEQAHDARILIVTESIFSMDGDRAPLRQIIELKETYGTLLLVDEAHAFGIIGPQGRGLAAQLGVADRVDLHMGTLSKAAGLSGGFLAGPKDYIDLCIQRARSFIYSTAPPPALAAAARQRIDVIAGEAGDERRKQLWDNLRQLARKLDLPEPTSAIVPIILGSNQNALDAAEQLLQQGYLIPAIRYPTVPRDQARLRLTISADHSADQIEAIAAAIRKLA